MRKKEYKKLFRDCMLEKFILLLDNQDLTEKIIELKEQNEELKKQLKKDDEIL